MPKFLRSVTFLLIIITSNTCVVVTCAEFTLHQILTNPDPGPRDFFGDSVAVSSDYILVGSQAFGTVGDDYGNAGQTYLFDARSGELLRTLNDPDLVTSDFFGRGVAISGRHLLIGAASPFDGRGGQVHVFDALTGQLRYTFAEPDGGDDFFPSAMAISGDYVLVASEAGQTLSGPPFPAEVFLWNAATGSLLHKFDPPPSLTSGSGFGELVSINGNTIAIGAPHNGPQGDVFLYDATSGNLVNSFSDASLLGFSSLATDGERVLIGHDGGSNSEQGRALLFDAAGNLIQQFADPEDDPNFLGYSVAFSGENILVASAAGSRAGRDVHVEALLFNTTTGNLVERLDDPAPAAFFYSIAASSDPAGERIVLGAYTPIESDIVTGHVLVYDRVPEPTSPVLAALAAIAWGLLRRRRLAK